MTITFNTTYILLASESISEMIATPGDYTKVEITGDINCCTSNCGNTVNTISIDTPFTDTDDVEFTSDGIKILPSFFGLTEFIDGIYKFDVKRFADGGNTVLESNCSFVDITIKCKVAALLKNILEENKIRQGTEKISTMAHLLHYSLFNGSNCGCNCTEMCEVFRELVSLLATVNPQIFIDCGC